LQTFILAKPQQIFGQSANWLADCQTTNEIPVLRLPIEMLFALNCFESANGIKQILNG